MRRSPHHPSYQDIARKAGVSLMTVSLAMRNSPRISEATRTRVQRIAIDLGYTADPRISEMMNYLRARRTSKDQPVLALVNAREAPLARLQAAHALAVARSATEQAQRQGYRLEEFWLGQPGMTERRLSDVLEARGIRGIVLLPLPPGRQQVNLRWNRFAAVSTCYLSYAIGLHQISTNRQHYIEVALRELRRLGYRRVGLAIDHDMDVRSHHQTLGHYLWDQSQLPAADRVRELYAATLEIEGLRRWLDDQRPDVVVSPRNHVHGLLTKLGYRMPRDLGFASLAASARDVSGLTGVDERSEMVGVAAIDFLIAMLQRGEFGIPKIRQFVMIEASWIAGRTVRKAKRAARGALA